MSYKTATLGVAECLAMVFIMTFPRIFLTSPSRVILEQANAAWLSELLLGLSAIMMLFVINRLFKHQSGDLLAAAELYLGKPGKWLIGLYYFGMFLTDAVLLTRQFTENTLITAMPWTEYTVILLAYGITLAIIVTVGLESLCRTVYIIMPFGLLGIFAVLLLLLPYYEVYSLFPLRGRGLDILITNSILSGGANVACIAPALMASCFHDRKTWFTGSLMGIGLSVVTKTTATFVFLLVFGVAVGQERTMPFYELSRLIYLGRFFQRVEALFIILWVIGGLAAIGMHIYVAIYLLGRLLNLPSLRPLIPITVILVASLSAAPEDVVITLELETLAIKSIFNGGLYGIPLLFLLLSFFKGHKKARRDACQER